MQQSHFGADMRRITCTCQAGSDPWLGELLADWAQCGRLKRSSVYIMPSGRPELAAEWLGFSPLINPKDGSRYGDHAFRPFWKLLRKHGDWFEMDVAICDREFSVVLLIKDGFETDWLLRKMCHEFAE